MSGTIHTSRLRCIPELFVYISMREVEQQVPVVVFLDDAEYLPGLLVGCNGMLGMSGVTYTSRLWCILELFVYIRLDDRQPK